MYVKGRSFSLDRSAQGLLYSCRLNREKLCCCDNTFRVMKIRIWSTRKRKTGLRTRKRNKKSTCGDGLEANYLASHLQKTPSTAEKDKENSGSCYSIPEKARQFDTASSVSGDRVRGFLKARADETSMNGASSLVTNSLAFAVHDVASVVSTVKKNRRHLSHASIENVYDWINLCYEHGICPLLRSLSDDILPEFDRFHGIASSSMLSRKNREESFSEVHSAFKEVLESFGAFIPQLPAGERAFALVYAFNCAEEKIAVLLWAFRKLSRANVYSSRANNRLVKLEQYVFNILIFGGDAAFSLDMRGILTAWMSDQEFRATRVRIGIRAIDISAQRQLQRARLNFPTRTVLGRFPADLEKFLIATQDSEMEERQKLEEEGRIDPDVVHRLNIMTAERMMMKVNGEIDLEDVALEDITGEVHENDTTLYYGNYRQHAAVRASV